MRSRSLIPWLAILATCALLAGCATTPTAVTLQPTSTATLAPTDTPAPTATTAPPVVTTFTCLATVNGTAKVFSDSATGVSFSYPAAWIEQDCERLVSADGSQGLLIGNLFSVGVYPRDGQSVQQWMGPRVGSDETVTLTPLTVAHALAAYRLSVTPSPTAARPPYFLQTLAIIEGTQDIYTVSGFVAQMSMTDTMPNTSVTTLIPSFDVP